jgi:hypothetical protein
MLSVVLSAFEVGKNYRDGKYVIASDTAMAAVRLIVCTAVPTEVGPIVQ